MTLYTGRIDANYSDLMDRINRSLPVDIRLLPYDVLTNRAWAGQLRRLDVLTEKEHKAILKALDQIRDEAAQGAYLPLPDDEDVHTLVERRLTEICGDAGAKIHAGRSRNDQVVCDLRMITADTLVELGDAVAGLAGTLGDLAVKHADTLLAGTTHLQPAQPITLGFFLLSLAFALVRDLERIVLAYDRANRCPLGAGALAGSGFPVDRQQLAEELGFSSIAFNALDAVSDRDFVQETASVCALLCTHLSRYAEQFVFWSNPALGYIRFADAWSTGSSMMPQKKNPDAMELVRGKAARCLGNATTLVALTKGLPLSYAKDLQEDKEPLFDSLDTALLCVRVFDKAVGSATFFPDRMEKSLVGAMLATDLADALVLAGVPFRKAHERVARFVGELEDSDGDLLDVSQQTLAEHFGELKDRPVALTFADAVARRNLDGGTAPDSVRRQAQTLRMLLDDFWNNRRLSPRAR